MATPQSTFQRSLAAGELAPALHARADQVKYLTGLRRCRNFLVQREGGATNRPGTRFVAPCMTNDIDVMLMRYVSENVGESVLIEVNETTIRFYVNGALLEVDSGTIDPYGGGVDYVVGDLVTAGGVVYYSLEVQTGVAPPGASWYAFTGETFELPSPFGEDLPHWNQSGRTITLTHRDHVPYELINGGALTSWIFRPVVTETAGVAPVGLVVTPGGNTGTLTIAYVVTSATADSYEESIASGVVINSGIGLPDAAMPDVLAWTAVPGAAEYYVYMDPAGNGIFGYIGTAQSNGFTNTGILPDFLSTPPLARPLFASTDNYPDRSGNFQQRRLFGFTNNAPDAIFGSRTGFASNFGISQPLQDDDAITFRIAGNNHNPIKHLLSLKGLIAATGAGAWTITGGGPNLPLTPSQLEADQTTYTGFGEVPPVLVGNSIIYVEHLGRTVFDLQFDQQVEGLGGKDLTIFASHLFRAHTIRELDYAQNPDSVVWCCRDDGTLLGLTYIREQEVLGWHRHDSGASCRFEHVCVVPEADGDTVYFITRRTINGGFTRQIERFVSREIITFDTDAFFVDCGLSYSGAPVNNVAGLGHLEGEVVAVVGDGAVIFNGDATAANAGDFTITAGTFPIDFPASYSNIHVGIPITAQLETLDLDVQGSQVRDRRKRVAAVTLLLERSSRTFRVGPDVGNLTQLSLEPYETMTDEFTGPVELTVVSQFDELGRVFIHHTDPLPLTVLGILPSVELGG